MAIQIQKNYPLKKYNTFGIDVFANYFSEFQSINDLQEILLQTTQLKLSTFILGGGSNVLFTNNYNGLVLKNEIKGIETIHEDESHVYIKAGAGESWHRFVMHCVDKDFAGVENLSLIPGSVGASPMQNIGAYGVEVKDIFYSLEAFHLKEKEITSFTLNDCEFGYRESVFKKKFRDQFIILNVTYKLNKKADFNISYGAIKEELQRMNVSQLSIKTISEAIINIRNSKLPDPNVLGNAGSFFKNPTLNSHELRELHQLKIPFYKIDEAHYKIPAGWLIEQCGWKGYRNGDAGCYEKQALVLVNYGNATGNEIYNLSEEIKISVKEKFGIELEREVNIL
jgi:UDP-N-acetylmuramate dehydrogenase